MTSQVNWSLLGLLLERPDYGYKLRQRFEAAYSDVLPLNSESHVYAALNQLESRGFIEIVPGTEASQSGTSRQPKLRYRATTQGARSYRDWMLEQAGEDRRQSQLFVRQLAGFAHEPHVARQILDSYRRACLREACDNQALPVSDSVRGTASNLAHRLASEERRLGAAGKLPWIQYAMDNFRALEERRDNGPS